MDESGCIPKIVELLNVPNFRFVSIILLYLLSVDDKIRYTFAYTDCMKIV